MADLKEEIIQGKLWKPGSHLLFRILSHWFVEAVSVHSWYSSLFMLESEEEKI